MNNHKLTEFFPRKSQPKATDMPDNVINEDQEVISSSSSSVPTKLVADVSNPPFPPKPRTRTVMAAVEIVSPRASEKRHSRSTKRSCSPGIQRMGPSKSIKQISAALSKPSAKRKKKFDSDSDVEPLNTIIYVPKVLKSASLTNTVVRSRQFGPLVPKENLSKAHHHTRVRLPSYKKQRLSSPDTFAEDMVPSSQSDEQEMSLPGPIKKDAREVKDSIDQWRKAAVSSSPDELLIIDTAQAFNINVDVPLSSPLSSDSLSSLSPLPPETDVCTRLETMSTNPSTKHLVPSQATPSRRTPALTAERPSVPATPMVLDVESKTARVIAQIKAAAYAAAFSSPEPEASELKPLDDSSDDEAIHDPFSSPLSSPTVHPARPYNLRNQAAPSPSSITPLRSSARSRSLSKRPTRAARANTRSTLLFQCSGEEKVKLQASSTTRNPLEMLLKEKKLADKRGKGPEALLLAENTMVGKSTMRAAMDEEQEHGSEGDWTNEEAALMAVCEGDRLGSVPSSPVRSPSGSDYLTWGEMDRERLLGPKSGKAVTNILKGDKAKMEQTTGKDKALGVALWNVTCAEMERAASSPDHMFPDIFSGTKIQSVLGPLKDAVERGDIPQAALFLNSGIIAAIGPSKCAGIVPVLYDLALSIHETCLSESAFRVLLHLWRDGHPAAVTITLPLIWTTLARLGAKVDVFLRMEWEIEMDKRDVNVDAAKRANLSYRLVSLLTASARARGLKKEDMPDILVVLLLMALDPSSSRDLKTDLTVAVDVVCRSLAPGAGVCAEVEASTSAKLIKFASGLTPINKAHLLSFMTGPHARTRRLARYLAYGLLVGEEVVSNEDYEPLPPLSNLYELLMPSATSVGPFSVQESTDYEDMGYYVDIISVVLLDIDTYVAQEHYGGPLARDLDCSPSRGGKEKPLEIIRSAIDGIHARIADTRAAHLDRSRTKAALQRLSMRIFYQRLAALKSNQDSGKPRNLRDHWSSR